MQETSQNQQETNEICNCIIEQHSHLDQQQEILKQIGQLLSTVINYTQHMALESSQSERPNEVQARRHSHLANWEGKLPTCLPS